MCFNSNYDLKGEGSADITIVEVFDEPVLSGKIGSKLITGLEFTASTGR